MSETSVEGWAIDASFPDIPVEITVSINGCDIWTGMADQYRQDLHAAQIGDGNHAFYARVYSELLPDGGSEWIVRAYFTRTGDDLALSPAALKFDQPGQTRIDDGHKALQDSEIQSVTDVPSVDDLESRDLLKSDQESHGGTVRAESHFSGSLDVVDEFRVSGWAFNRQTPHLPVSVDIFGDDGFLSRVDADIPREDLARAGFGAGKCSFILPTPIALLDGRRHVVRAIITNTAIELPLSPVTVELSSAVPAQILTQLRFASQQSFNMLKKIEQLMDEGFPNRLAKHQSLASDFQLWNARFSAIDATMRAAMLERVLHLQSKPRFSIVMPTYKTPKKLLEGAIQSVLDQIYPYWELCIADDASGAETEEILRSMMSTDSRIKVTFRRENGHISEATNTALRMAQGDYVCFMDHDDLLTEDALFQMALAVDKSRPDIIYSDEDKVDSRNIAVEPHFKPDFNYSLLLSYNYICHFLAIRRDVIEVVGDFVTTYNGSQDHDYLLRCCEVVDPHKVVHIPLVLYHWRAHEGSTATNIGTKNYALEAGIKAIEHHLARLQRRGDVSLGPGNSYRVTWQLPDDPPLVSIIIPTRDGAKILAVCLLGILTHTSYPNIEVIILDNGSEEKETFDLFKEINRYANVRVVPFDGPFNYSRICNFGAREASGDLLLMLNNDIEVLSPDWLSEMVGQILQTDVAAVGAKLLYPDGRIQHGGVILGIGGVAGHAHKFLNQDEYGYMNRANVVHDLSACTAACLLIRRDIFDLVEGFNEEHLGVAFNDVDLCLKIVTAGYRIVFTPYATLRHHESLSRGAENTPAKVFRSRREVTYMIDTWKDLLKRDPHYSPNLTLKHEDFRIDPTHGFARIECLYDEPRAGPHRPGGTP